MTTQTRTAQTPRVDFFVNVPWRTILDLATEVADRKVTTGADSPESIIDQLRSLVASVKVEKDSGDAAKKAVWAQFTHFVKNGSRDGVFKTGDGRDTGNLVHSLILGYRDWNLEAFKDVSGFVGGSWKFDVAVFPALIERAKGKFSELKGVDRLQAMRDLQPKVDCLVEFVEKQALKRTRRETGDAAKSAAAGLRAERDGKPADTLEVQPMAVTTGAVPTAAALAAANNEPAPVDAPEPSLDEQVVDLQARIQKLFGEADALRAVDRRDKNATAKENAAFGLEAELKVVQAAIAERERVAELDRLIVIEREALELARVNSRAIAEAAKPVVAAVQSEPARQTVIEHVRESFGIAGVASSDDPMAQIRAAAKAGDELAKSVLAGYAAGKHPTAERAIQVARDLGVI